MSRYDKVKVNSIETNANYYVHPETHEATIIKQDPTHRFVSDEQILAWTNKAAAQLADAEHNGLMTKEDKAKLDGIAAGANNYHYQKPYLLQSLNRMLIIASLQIKNAKNLV